MEDEINAELAKEQDSGSAPNERTVELEATVASKESEIAGLKDSKATLEARVEELGRSLAGAVSGYREMVARANPDVLPELIRGESVEAIGESLKQARELVSRVKQGIEASVSLRRFPAGAPERGGVETELSPREKIEHGIRHSR